ncbi:MAG: hypothetical protein ABJF11_01650 [Reichenbachiella sp.]|uniref:hypothetical protein n=1 Tax=Reichenbachiella sp. TaxID=2184521 RepID=UPI003263398F
MESEVKNLSEEQGRLSNTASSLDSKLGWKEKYLSGLLGGDRKLVQKVDETESQIEEIGHRIDLLKKKLKEKPERVKKIASTYLEENDGAYANLVTERKLHYELYKASKHYHDLVKKANQGVIDALLFLSWSKLINHPEASEKLTEFKNETSKYQKVVDRFHSKSKYESGNSVKFIELIKFGTEQEAMSSFAKITKQSNLLLKYADKYLKKSKKEILDYRAPLIKNLSLA